MNNKFSISIPVAILITFSAVIYQRSTGPTYPYKSKIEIGESVSKVKLLRSHEITKPAPVILPLLSPEMSASLIYKRYPSNDSWTTVEMKAEKDHLHAELPVQPPAGKVSYFLQIKNNNKTLQTVASQDAPIVLRYKGAVPNYVLFPHIALMFIAMLLACLAGVESLYKTKSSVKLARITLGCLVVGGLILGPLVQKYAFGVYWAGFPFDWDLTDNKLLISVMAWVIAVAANWNRMRPAITFGAMIVLVGMYLIPHSMNGSQFNHEKGMMEYK